MSESISPVKKIDRERLASNLTYLVERTNDFGIEKLSTIWFELFDVIESCRLFSSDEKIFEVQIKFFSKIEFFAFFCFRNLKQIFVRLFSFHPLII